MLGIRYRTDILLLFFVGLQVCLWNYSKEYEPDFSIVPDVPSDLSVKAFSFGDEQFYFRVLGYQLQNAGDTYGRFTALKKYNYLKLYHWFRLLDSLDSKSNYIASLAGYYYSQTQNTPDVRYVVDYLDEHASRDLHNKWWWMSQAVYLANHKLKDKELALNLAYKLASTPRDDIPLWAKQMPAFIHEQLGQEEEALIIIKQIVENIEDLEPGEINFMYYFVKERLKKIIKNHPELNRLERENTYVD